MAVISFSWIGEGRSGGGDTIEGQQTRTRVARVWTDNPFDGEDVVLLACGANGAALGDSHPDNVLLICERRTADNLGATKVIWIVTCAYKNFIDNPLDEPAKIKVSGQLFQAPIMFDVDGNLITNAAGFPLVDPAPEADFPRRLVTVKKNIADPSVADPIFALQNSLNQQELTIWPTFGTGMVIGVKKAKLREPEIEGPEERNGVKYFVLNLSIDWRSEGWDDPLLNAGYRDRNGEKITWKGTEPDHPWPLDEETGMPLTPAQIQAGGVFQVKPKRYLTKSWALIIALV